MKILFALLFGLIFLPASVYAGTNCSNSDTQTKMNICSFEEYQEADRELNEIYKQAKAQLGVSEKSALLERNQKAWLIYRDLTCAFEAGTREESGTIWPLIQNNCLTRLTRYRAAEIPNGFMEGLE